MPARTFAIGDIHGCLKQFDALLESIALTPRDHLILLGDLIDRGPESAGVIHRVQGLRLNHRVTVIMGNHEQMMLDARDSHAKQTDWLRGGGDATLRSYAGSRGKLRDVPFEDWEFLTKSLVDFVEDDTHIFVHANADPDVAMSKQREYTLRWDRDHSRAAHKSGKVVVCGHTPQRTGRPLNLGHCICLDTDASRGGKLTCMEVKTGKIWQANGDGKVERSHISDYVVQ